MDWTVADYGHANHNPVVEVNGQKGSAPIYVTAHVGQPVVLDAGKSTDPDGQRLHFKWFHYAEAGSTGTNLAAVTLTGSDSSKATVTATTACRPLWLPGRASCNGKGSAHIILAVTDEGRPRLTSYRRVILNVE